MLSVVRQFLMSPRFADSAKDHQSRLLYPLILTGLLVYVIYAAVLWLFDPTPSPYLVAQTILPVLALLGLLWLTRQGYTRSASILLLLGSLLVLIIDSATAIGVFTPDYLALSAVVLLGGVMLNRRFSMILAILGTLAGIVLLLLQGETDYILTANDAFQTWLMESALLFVSIVLMIILTGSLRAAIAQLQHSETSLATRNSELQRVNRRYQMLTECNRALIHASDESALLQTVCELIVNTGGYFAAWVGYVQHDEQRTIQLLASAGHGKPELLKRSRDFRWIDEPPYNQRPMGRAVLENRAIVVHDMQSAPFYALIRDDMNHLPINSMLALPLVCQGEIIGVLAMNTTYPHAFDPPEVELLTSLANDLAYGIGVVRIRDERAAALLQFHRLNAELEDRVARRTAELTSFINAIPDYVYVVDRESGRIKYCNDVFAGLVGSHLTREQIQGKTLYELVPPDLAARIQAEHQQVYATGSDFHRLEDLHLPDRTLHLDTYRRPLRRADGTLYGLISTSHDITGVILTEHALSERTAQLETLIANFPAGTIVVFDRDLRFQIAGGEALAVLNRSRSSLEGKTIHEAFPPQTAAWLEQNYRRALAGESVVVESEYFGRSYQTTVHPLRDPGGEITGGLSIVRDITEAKEAEAVLRLALVQERELNTVRQNFVSMLSHDFGNRLAIIASASSMLGDYLDRLSDEQRQLRIRHIQTAVQQLNAMIGDILEYSRGETLHVQANRTLLDVVEHCQRIVSEYQVAVEHTHHLIFTSEEAALDAWLDPRLLNQILSNLLSNAVKYSPNASQVEIHLTRRDAAELVLSVRDFGPGITADELPHLFELYWRGKHIQNIKGTGLGLTIVKQAVEALGGSIEVDSTPGAGAIFNVFLPLPRSGD